METEFQNKEGMPVYAPGDVIVHPMHGAGQIEEIVEQKVAGETRSYYVLQIPTGSVRVMVPVEGSAAIGIRPLIDRETAYAVLDAFAELPTEDDKNWNRRYRENMLRLKSGDLYEVSRVVRGLMLRERSHGLSTGERKMLGTSRQILLSELELATGESHDALLARLAGTL